LHPRLVTFGLVALLLLATVVLGLTFGGGSAVRNTGGSGGQSRRSQTNTGSFPKIVVQAETYGLATVEVLPSSNGTSFTGPRTVVATTSRPIAGLRFVLTSTEASTLSSGVGGASLYTVETNSSGMGQLFVLPDNYTVTADGTYFNFTTTVDMRVSTTTFLHLKVEPTLNAVSSVDVMNQDRNLGAEPTATIYANADGSFNYSSGTPYLLIGYLSDSPAQLTLVVKVIGTYAAPSGEWVVMRPTAPYGAVPSTGVELLHYATYSTVSYIYD
jgi:hypothetical protein